MAYNSGIRESSFSWGKSINSSNGRRESETVAWRGGGGWLTEGDGSERM